MFEGSFPIFFACRVVRFRLASGVTCFLSSLSSFRVALGRSFCDICLESWHTCEWVMAHMWMSHGTHVNESWHTYEWVMTLIWMSHGTHVNESIWMSHGRHVNESWHTCEWVMTLIWMSHGTHMNESWNTCEWVMAYMWMSPLSITWRTISIRDICVDICATGENLCVSNMDHSMTPAAVSALMHLTNTTDLDFVCEREIVACWWK